MRNIQISIETAQRWFNGTDIELKELAVQTYPELAEKELPKTWEELKSIAGYYVCSDSLAIETDDYLCHAVNKSIFFTKEQAEASIALAQLSQLREVYRNGWIPDTKNITQYKYCIGFRCGEVGKAIFVSFTTFLSFKDEETRDLFLENFRELIEKAKPLIS
jgi:hypothetical protein